MQAKKLTAIMLGLLVIGPAKAYDSNDDRDLFKERDSEAYRPRGIRASTFMLLPSFDIAEEYNSNVFYRDKRTPGAIKSDYVTHYKPSLSIGSDWSRHALNLLFDSDLSQYATLAEQADYQDLKASANGRVDFTRDSVLSGRVDYNQLHSPRSSIDQTQGKGPTLFTSQGFEIGYRYVLNRVTLKGEFDGNRMDYQNVQTSNGQMLDMQSQNHWHYAPSVRLGYFIQPEYEAFFKVVPTQMRYDGLVRANGSGAAFNRNSKGYNALGGLAFELTELMTGDISIGYLTRSYEDASLQSIAGINGFFNLKWRPTGLTTITARVARDIAETTQAYVSGIKTDSMTIMVEHELLRSVLFSLGGSYTMLSYQSSGQITERHDKNLSGQFGVRYLLNRNLSGQMAYSYQNRDTNIINSAYTGQMLMFSLRGQF